MIISHEHRYVFVALPQTGSTSISKELVANYGGTPILTKHARYHQLLLSEDRAAHGYFSFGTIRNPLEVETTIYARYSDPTGRRAKGSEAARRDFVQQGHSFDAYLRMRRRLPYDDWSSCHHQRLDALIRYERLADDFAGVIERLGLELVRPLPNRNPTPGKQQWQDYYADPATQRLALAKMGPYMRRWGYEAPEDWAQPGRAQRWVNEWAAAFLRPARRYFREARPMQMLTADRNLRRARASRGSAR